jgi:hypothetical protein
LTFGFRPSFFLKKERRRGNVGVLFHLTARLTARVTLRFGTFLSSKERQTPAMDETRENPLLRKKIFILLLAPLFLIFT